MGYHRAGKLRDGEHAAFDMHMAIAEAWTGVASASINDFCLGTDTVTGVTADEGEASVTDGDIRAGNDFAGVHIHPPGIPDYGVGGFAAIGHGHKVRAAVSPGFQCRHALSFNRAFASSNRLWQEAAKTLPPCVSSLPSHVPTMPPAPRMMGSRAAMS